MATYYVSAQNGNDSNNGTSVGTAKASFSAGMALLSSAGDKLYIGPGYYKEASTTNVVGDGTIADPIQIIGDTDAKFLTSDNPGEVVVAIRTATNDIPAVDLLSFNGDNNFYFKNIIFLAGAGSSAVDCIRTSNSDGLYFENCMFQGGYYGLYGDNNNDVTCYNCVAHGARSYGFYRVNVINCVGMGGFVPIHQCYVWGSLSIAGYRGMADCYSDPYGYASTDYGSVHNSSALFAYGDNFSAPNGGNLFSYGAGAGGIESGNGYHIGSFSLNDYRSYNDGMTQNSGVFPNVNSGSGNSTCYYAAPSLSETLSTGPNYSPDSADFTVTKVSSSMFIGYTGMQRDLMHIFRPRIPMQSGPLSNHDQMFPTASTGLDYFTTKITGSIGGPTGNRYEAFLAFVSGSGIRFDANPLKDAYTPPGEQDALGTPLLSFSQSLGYNDQERVRGGFPGYAFPNVIDLEFGASFISSSDHAIKITDYGAFTMGTVANSSITASVGVKYNAGTPPELRIVNKDTGEPLVSQAASGTGDQTSAYQHLSVQTTSSGNSDIVLYSPHPPASSNPHGTSGAIVYFTDLKINEG